MNNLSRLFFVWLVVSTPACSLELAVDESDTQADYWGDLDDSLIGTQFRMTVYHQTLEQDFPLSLESPIYSSETCEVLARVSSRFKEALQLQGSGRLYDGRGIHFVAQCKKLARCEELEEPTFGNEYCYALAEDHAPFGLGANNKAIIPYRSVAVDETIIALNSLLHIPQLDGVAMPGDTDLVHNGCVVAADRGSAINDKDIDFFVPTMNDATWTSHALRDHVDADATGHWNPVVDVYEGGEQCRNFGVDVGWIGDRCDSDSDCKDHLRCRHDVNENGGYCTTPNCPRGCPDYAAGGYAMTQCVSVEGTTVQSDELDTLCAIECSDVSKGGLPCREGLQCQEAFKVSEGEETPYAVCL